MEPVALPYFSGLMSDITLGMFFALCGFGATCGLLVGAWRAVKLARRWQRRRRFLARLAEPERYEMTPEDIMAFANRNVVRPKGEVWIGCGCDWCAGAPARASQRA